MALLHKADRILFFAAVVVIAMVMSSSRAYDGMILCMPTFISILQYLLFTKFKIPYQFYCVKPCSRLFCFCAKKMSHSITNRSSKAEKAKSLPHFGYAIPSQQPRLLARLYRCLRLCSNTRIARSYQIGMQNKMSD